MNALMPSPFASPTTSHGKPTDVARYPAHLVRGVRLVDGRMVAIRPVRPEDGELEQDFVRSLSPRTRYYRFFNALKELSPAMLNRFIRVDYRRQMTLIAVVRDGGKEKQVGMAQYFTEPNADFCEFAVVVHDAWQRSGLGAMLIDHLTQCAKDAGLIRMEGHVMADNEGMLNLARKLGFSVRPDVEDATLMVVDKALSPRALFHRIPQPAALM